MAALDRLATTDAKGTFRAVLESPQGSRNKLKFVPEDDTFAVSASLPAGMEFPFDFGFIPGTRAQDGDPLDVLVLMDAPAYPGCVVSIRLLGVIEADQTDTDGKTTRNDRLVALAEGSTERGDPHRLRDLEGSLLDQIESFFETYDHLLGKTFRARARRGPGHAARLIKKTRHDG
jgi:inorganic pyrophosphatase